MSDQRPIVRISPWLGGGVLTLLVLQLGLLWLQGSLVQRQREDILGLREDVQAMAESLEDDPQGQAESEGRPIPVRLRAHVRTHARHRVRLVRAAWFQAKTDDDDKANGGKADELDAARRDLDRSKQSTKEALDKARDVQDKLSITENIRKAEDKAKVMAEGQQLRPWLWAGAGLALLAMIARPLLRRRG